MDRCRCEEYAAAVKKLKLYTVGTYRPDIVDNYDRSEYATAWIKMGITSADRRFSRPKSWKKLPPGSEPGAQMTERQKQLDQMWCPYMTPYTFDVFDVTE